MWEAKEISRTEKRTREDGEREAKVVLDTVWVLAIATRKPKMLRIKQNPPISRPEVSCQSQCMAEGLLY